MVAGRPPVRSLLRVGGIVPAGSKAEYYREQATRLREAAKKAKDPDARTEMMRTASEYEKLADAVERRHKRADG
jgi:hypothetical protein